jgi:uroporphyrinogen-III decarboxylase
MPVWSDLVLHERPDPEAVAVDGVQLGGVLEEAARRLHLPVALPHMDLLLEKRWMLGLLGLGAEGVDTFHFAACPASDMPARLAEALRTGAMPPALQAHVDSVRYIAERTDLLPVGMAIGPFSLMSKLLADPITPIAMAGAGLTAEEDDEIAMVERVLAMALEVVLASITRQLDAGAKAIFIAEPAANRVYLSPNQLDAGSDIFERYVVRPNQRITALLASRGADLFFHCCGDLVPSMVAAFAGLHPAVLSLGSSRKLWEDAALVPKDVVLYGNLPSKQFYSDALITCEQVESQSADLRARMAAVGHPFILGSECDVLSVPGCEDTIRRKIHALAGCGCAVPEVARDVV